MVISYFVLGGGSCGAHGIVKKSGRAHAPFGSHSLAAAWHDLGAPRMEAEFAADQACGHGCKLDGPLDRCAHGRGYVEAKMVCGYENE